MRVAASGAATWDLTRYIGPVRPQTSVGERPTLPTFSLPKQSFPLSSSQIPWPWSPPKRPVLCWLDKQRDHVGASTCHSGLLPSACPTYHPTSNTRRDCASPKSSRGRQSIWGSSLPRNSGGFCEIRGRAAVPTSLIQRANLQFSSHPAAWTELRMS
jgi:hypothetical protein